MSQATNKLAVSLIWLILLTSLSLAAAAEQPAAQEAAAGVAIVNPAIDDDACPRVAGEAMRHRVDRRLSEAEFIGMSREPGTVVLDARSKAKFDELHVAGALHLSFADIAIASLAALLPDKEARILLIYCNNNFRGAEGPFPSKLPSASLNLPTYVVLYDYGYRNVYELGPLIDIDATAIEFATSAAPVP